MRGFLILLVSLCINHSIVKAGIAVSINVSNITNAAVDKYIFGMNMYSGSNDLHYTGNYTLARLGGDAQSLYNWKINATNSGNDWYFITQSGISWTQYFDAVTSQNIDLMVQIPSLGWVASTKNKVWSFSIQKYGAQQKNECTGQGNATWCSKDAGNGVWMNGSKVTGNNPYDAAIKSSPSDASDWVKAIISRYTNKYAKIFMIANEPVSWWVEHHDVRPAGITYEQLWNTTLIYGETVKQACNYECELTGPSPWGWCAYYTDGKDNQNGGCTTGNDRTKHGNTPLLQWYLQQAAAYEKANGKRLLDYLDIHYYPNAAGVTFNCNEDATTISNRLQSPRSLYDWSYVDPSWINEPLAIIPRIKGWIDESYPGTKLSISEYNFGGDTCITSTMAHAEVLAIFATYGVSMGTRWSKPAANSMVTNAFRMFMNYDGNGNNIFGNQNNPQSSYTVYCSSQNVWIITSYSIVLKDESKMFVVLFNKDTVDDVLTVNVSLIGDNSNKFNINGDVSVYGIDDKVGLHYVGKITATNSKQFDVVIPKLTVRLMVINLS